MPRLTPQIPLLPDKTQPGYQLIDNYGDLIKQNMKMILLTNPGERVMMPDFGVGLTGMLFENMADPEMLSYFKGRIGEQIQAYLPFVDLQEVNFLENEIDNNKISVQIRYFIPSMDEEDVLYI